MIYFNENFNKVIYKNIKPNNTIYSDRLYQWDDKKFNRLKQKYFGNENHYWDIRKLKEIEDFLKDYLEKDISLVYIQQYENKSNGYPYWRFEIFDSTFNLKKNIDSIVEKLSNEEKELIKTIGKTPILRKLLSTSEIKVLNKLVKKDVASKGHSDDKKNTIQYSIDSSIWSRIL